MKKVTIAFEVEDGKLTPHDHPVFTGDKAYDLNQEQEVQVNKDLDVREFNGAHEVMTALNDYFRECPAEEQEELTDFVLLEMYSGRPDIASPAKVARHKKTGTGKK